MNLVGALVATIVALVGYLIYQYKKHQASQALNDNIATKEKVDEIQKSVDKNDALIDVEKQKQTEAQQKLDEEKKKDVSKDDLLDYFNKSNK